MLKNSLKHLLKFMLFVFIGFAFTTNASAFSVIENNDSTQKAYPIGLWEYHGSIIGKLAEGKDEAYFTFIAPSKSDKVYVRSWSGVSVEIVNSYGDTITHSDAVKYPTTFPYVKVNAKSDYETFYVKITRTSATGNVYYTVSVENRIKTGFKVVKFPVSAYNPGNKDYLSNPSGVDSSELFVDLTEDDSIPNKAIIKRVSTSGHVNKQLGGITHKLYFTSKNTWYTAIVKGRFSIDTSYDIDLKQLWKFKYNFK